MTLLLRVTCIEDATKVPENLGARIRVLASDGLHQLSFIDGAEWTIGDAVEVSVAKVAS